MKTSIAKLCPEFNMHRMVTQYTNGYYLAAHGRYLRLAAEDSAKARQLAGWLGKVEGAWPRLAVESVAKGEPEITLGDPVHISARVALNGLNPEDVTVEVVSGRVDAHGEVLDPVVIAMQPSGPVNSGSCSFGAVLQTSTRSGLHGYAIRVLPKHPDSVSPFLPNLISWASGSSLSAERSATAGGD
jgi:starch phosphorylase